MALFALSTMSLSLCRSGQLALASLSSHFDRTITFSAPLLFALQTLITRTLSSLKTLHTEIPSVSMSAQRGEEPQYSTDPSNEMQGLGIEMDSDVDWAQIDFDNFDLPIFQCEPDTSHLDPALLMNDSDRPVSSMQYSSMGIWQQDPCALAPPASDLQSSLVGSLEQQTPYLNSLPDTEGDIHLQNQITNFGRNPGQEDSAYWQNERSPAWHLFQYLPNHTHLEGGGGLNLMAIDRDRSRTPEDYPMPDFSSEDGSGSDYSDSDGIEAPIPTKGRKESDRHRAAARSSKAAKKPLQLTKANPKYVPDDAYQCLLHAPPAWGPFRYTKDGELKPSDVFSTEEITQYLFEHPLHKESPSKQVSKLVLRIHRNPPDSSDRFPTVHGSHRCRFRDCPAINNTLGQGQYCVSFDELTTDHPQHDPYLNAGWVHLYCIERFMDFPEICRQLNVQAEMRVFDREPWVKQKGHNRMRLDNIRGLETMVEKFIANCRTGTIPRNYPYYEHRDENGAPYEGTLCFAMNFKKRRTQPKAVNRQEAAREKAAGRKGGTLGNHLGNLVVEGKIRHSTRKHENQNQLIARPRHHRVYKHDAAKSRTKGAAANIHQHMASKDPQRLQGGLSAPTANMVAGTTQRHQVQQVQPNINLVAPTALRPQSTSIGQVLSESLGSSAARKRKPDFDEEISIKNPAKKHKAREPIHESGMELLPSPHGLPSSHHLVGYPPMQSFPAQGHSVPGQTDLVSPLVPFGPSHNPQVSTPTAEPQWLLRTPVKIEGYTQEEGNASKDLED